MAEIVPQIPKGFRDFLPQKLIYRQRVIETIRKCFESFGFEPLETPTLEYAETLEGKYGQEGEKLIYKFEDKGGRKLALRYDLTIPLSRVVGMYPELVKPFKRYQISPVWRADKPQKGRFREFWQCDVDIVGTRSILADAEIVCIIFTVLKKLGFEKFTIKVNNRKLLNGIVIWGGIDEKRTADFLRSLDKLSQFEAETVQKELRDKGFPETALSRFFRMLEDCKDSSNLLPRLKAQLSTIPSAAEGIRELEELFLCLKNYSIPSHHVIFDLSLARGLDYYTGIIHETVVEEPKIGSITGGGRYDNLIGLFYGSEVPATGTSFGLERICAVMEELSMLPPCATSTQVLLTLFNHDLLGTVSNLATQLRSSGINAEVYLQEDRLKKQLGYANSKGIPWVIIIGPDELQKGIFVLRNMGRGDQEEIPLGGIDEAVRRIGTCARGQS
jgi:histidyl-tRNA synthetase